MIAAIVLAAGEGSRFGGDGAKVIALLDGLPLVRHVVERLLTAGLSTILVTASTHASAVAAALEGSEARVVPVPAGTTLSGSLQAGVAALPDGCAGFFVALGDQPLIDPDLVARLRATWEASNVAAVVPMYRGGVPGHPVFFDATMRRRLASITGDRGARDLLRDMGERVGHVAVDAPAPLDVDTPGDLDSLGGA